MVFRIYSERKSGYTQEADSLLNDVKNLLGISTIEAVRVLNRYDIENIDEDLLETCKQTVFGEAAIDVVSSSIEYCDSWALAVEYLPGQYDIRADAAEQCIQLISQDKRPIVRTAKLYLFSGEFDDEQKMKIKQHLINPVECREASLDMPETLSVVADEPTMPMIIDGFCGFSDAELVKFIQEYGLAMDTDDLALCREYFKAEGRDPSITEIKVLDTYWSDHCRHTTFNTRLYDLEFKDKRVAEAYNRYLELRNETGDRKPITLMDMATIGAKYLKKRGLLNGLDESPEINACTVKINVAVDDGIEPWLLLFKNETHNHPTEIEPFGGAATCLGGAIRDPLSGRSYVYQAMRLSGASDPRAAIGDTIKGKLPQRRIVTTAARGYSSYGNQIGLATGIVDEFYHPGYTAKHLELGAVLGAAPSANVKREEPAAGDVVLLIGGKTGRDGCGGATGSSKAHTTDSLETCGAEVQKGNAPEERKLQRLFRDPEVSRCIKRCNDFGAGGVSVAIGELADGLSIDLDAVPRKYDGLDATELAISESQERMAVVVEATDVEKFIKLATKENLTATRVAVVTEEPRLIMRYHGNVVVNMSRSFIDTNGAPKVASAIVGSENKCSDKEYDSFANLMKDTLQDINVCSKRGMQEMFDSTIGAGSVLMPFSGSRQRSPAQAMVAKIPVINGEVKTCSVMAWGFDPYISEVSPYTSAYSAVIESVSKVVASGARYSDCYLSLQEFFPKLKNDRERWGLPVGALLGALMAQIDLGIAAIGGKDSMSGSFENLDVPATLVSFAVSTTDLELATSGHLKKKDSYLTLVQPEYSEDGLPKPESFKKLLGCIHDLIKNKKALSVYTPTFGGVAAAIFKMAVGEGLGVEFCDGVSLDILSDDRRGAFVVETPEPLGFGVCIGKVIDTPEFRFGNEVVSLYELEKDYEGVLESVYPTSVSCTKSSSVDNILYDVAVPGCKPKFAVARPKVVVPVFPGTNCEYESAKAFMLAGADVDTMVINTLSAASIRESVSVFASKLAESQVLFIPGGFSGGDEPDGSGKFITAFLRNPRIADGIQRLLEERDGLILGVCNGFQALIKLGLVPYGRIMPPNENAPTLTFNEIGVHRSKIVRTRIASNMSPWLLKADMNQIYSVPISHGEGRLVCSPEVFESLVKNGQIATQYVDENGNASMNIEYNPAGSMYAIEGITSPDGRVFGKMGHSERVSKGIYKNVAGEYDIHLFESAVEYFK